VIKDDNGHIQNTNKILVAAYYNLPFWEGEEKNKIANKTGNV